MRSSKVFKDLEGYKGRLEFAEEERGKTGKDIKTMLERILETKCGNILILENLCLFSRGEGLVVKRANSTYQVNSRGPDWVKVKPECVCCNGIWW
jgi:DNA ligase-4